MAPRPVHRKLDHGRPHVVAVGGFDPTGGAGLVRDFWAAEARGATAVLVPTAWTEQSDRGVVGFEPRSAAALKRQLGRALAAAPRGRTAVKVGMTATPALIAALLDALDGFAGPVVFDPVLGASHGGALFRGAATAMLPLARRATLTTPNLGEAARLAGQAPAATVAAARRAAGALLAAGVPAVLVKGGHLGGAATDLLLGAEPGRVTERRFTAARVRGVSPRGTGCSLATAIAVELAAGRSLERAVQRAKAWLFRKIRAAERRGADRWL